MLWFPFKLSVYFKALLNITFAINCKARLVRVWTSIRYTVVPTSPPFPQAMFISLRYSRLVNRKSVRFVKDYIYICTRITGRSQDRHWGTVRIILWHRKSRNLLHALNRSASKEQFLFCLCLNSNFDHSRADEKLGPYCDNSHAALMNPFTAFKSESSWYSQAKRRQLVKPSNRHIGCKRKRSWKGANRHR